MERREIHKKILLEYLIAFLWVLGLIFVLPKALGFFMPFVIGWIIAMIANPLVRLLERKVKIARKHSSVLITIVVLGAVILAIYCIASVLLRQAVSLMADLPIIIEEVQVQLNLLAQDMQGLYHMLPLDMKSTFSDLGAKIVEVITNFLSSISTSSLDGAGSIVKNVADFFFLAIITILSAYFFIAERESVVRFGRMLIPSSMAVNFNLIKENFTKALGGYFKAQFKIMFIIVGILVIGFWILDVKYACLLAIGVAMLDFLPVFGTGTVIFPWAFYKLITGAFYDALCLIIIYLVCQLARQLLQPKMVGDSVGLSPLTSLVFLFIGYRVKGIIGMIVGIPTGMVLISLYRAGLFDSLIRGAKILGHDISEYLKYEE